LGEGLIVKIFATKIGTTHLYSDNGSHQVATVLKLQKTVIGRIKTQDKDGYDSLVLVQSSEKAKAKKTLSGQFKDLNPKKVIEERLDAAGDNKLNDEFSINNLTEGDLISVIGTTKGKGFQGTVKRHGFQTGPKTHGSRNYRRPGSIGMTTPSRVVKGKEMAGHMGHDKKTIKKVVIAKIDEKTNTIWVKGHVVGPNKGELILKK